MSGDTLHVVLHQAPGKAPDGPDYWSWLVLGALLVGLLSVRRTRELLFRWLGRIRINEYEIDIPFFKIKGNVRYTTAGQEAAWKLYVELATRITANPLAPDSGILREALQSLYVTFGTMRETLKTAGPELAREAIAARKQPAGNVQQYTVVSLLLEVMNGHMRPFLSKWHPRLQEYESTRAAGASQAAHERAWVEKEVFRRELTELSTGLSQ
ncbi:MAG: hypothetical protein ICV83_29165 [Cytophagales bacterium]|nr:hypothetical protein [Cytophagales bacterium]